MVASEFISQGFQLPLPLTILLFGGLIALVIGLLRERIKVPRIQEAWMVLVAVADLASVYLLYQEVKALPGEVMVMVLWGQSPPLGGCFEIDMLSVFMCGSIAVLGLLVAVYSVSYMERESRLTEFYTLVTFMMAGMTGIALAGDFFTLFIFWELMGLSSYVLVAFLKRSWGPIEAGFKYLVMSAAAGAFLLMSMAVLYGMTGTLNFALIAASLRGESATPWMMLLFSCMIIGFGVKSAIVPLHTWLPDAHPEAPSPISALLSGIVIETGLYGLTRVLYLTFDPSFFQLPIAVLAVLTMSLANVLALLQTDIKRMLAYSSIAQIGYMLVGLSAGTVVGMQGLFLHVFNHSLMKGLAFLASGSLVHVAHTRDIDELKGVGRAMPLTSLALFVAFFGLGGVPSTSGFVSKFILFNSAIGVGLWWLALLGVLNSAFSMAYYLRVMKNLVAEPSDRIKGLKEAPLPMVAVSVAMAVLIIIFGVWPQAAANFAKTAAEALVANLDAYIQVILG